MILLLKLNFLNLITYFVLFKGSLTHLQALPIYMKFLLQVASDIRRVLEKFKNSIPFSLEICNKNAALFSLGFLCLLESSVQTVLQEIVNLSIKRFIIAINSTIDATTNTAFLVESAFPRKRRKP